MNIVNEIIEKNKTIKDSKKHYRDEIKKSDESLLDFIGENDLKISKHGLLINGNI